jgi:N-acetyltransferase
MRSAGQDACSPLDPSVALETDRVLLRPLDAGDLGGLQRIAFDGDTWRYFAGVISTDEELNQFVHAAVRDNQAGTRVVYTVVDKHRGACAGSTAYGNISYADRRVEIGWSWLGRDYRGSGLNRHCKYLLLRHAFECAGFERVEFKTDVRNQRARRALQGIGATEEGVLRSHTVMPDGWRRDTIYYSVLKPEWPLVRQRLFADIG